MSELPKRSAKPRTKQWLPSVLIIGVIFAVVFCLAFTARLYRNHNRARTRLVDERLFERQLQDVRSGEKVCYLYDSMDTDRKMERLVDLANLEVLFLYDCDIGVEGMGHVARIPNLRTFVLCGGNAGDEGLKLLAQNEAVENVVLAGAGVSDAGLRSLAALPALRALVFYDRPSGHPGIDGGAAVGALSELRRLEVLAIGGGWVTDRRVRTLQESLPRTEISTLTSVSQYWVDVQPLLKLRDRGGSEPMGTLKNAELEK